MSSADDDKARRSRVVAYVECSDPPSEVRTLEQWIVWRNTENLRMAEALADQLLASIERGDATLQ